MKKFISIALVIVLAFSVIALVGCGNKTDADTDAPAATLKFGMGVVSSYTAKSATEEANGEGEFNTTAVAVLLDADNKIVAIDLDSAQIKSAWTAEGKVVATEDFATKYDVEDSQCVFVAPTLFTDTLRQIAWVRDCEGKNIRPYKILDFINYMENCATLYN